MLGRPSRRYFASFISVLNHIIRSQLSCRFVLFLVADFVVQVLIDDHMGMLKMSVPSLCYTLQNYMLFVGISNLDVTTFQVCRSRHLFRLTFHPLLVICRSFFLVVLMVYVQVTYQLKLLTAGIFTVTMLQRFVPCSLITLLSRVV